jgi:hypothetical protein
MGAPNQPLPPLGKAELQEMANRAHIEVSQDQADHVIRLVQELFKVRGAIKQAIAVSTRSGDLAQIRLILREAIGMEG